MGGIENRVKEFLATIGDREWKRNKSLRLISERIKANARKLEKLQRSKKKDFLAKMVGSFLK